MVSEIASLRRESGVPATLMPNFAAAAAAAVEEEVAAGVVGFAAQQEQRGWSGALGMLQA